MTNATGKAGRECCRALSDAGYTVFGTTRSEHSGKSLTNIGVTPVVCDYTKEMPKALQVSGAKLLLFITDFFKAAKNNADTEEAHGKHAVDAAKAAGVHSTRSSSPSRTRRSSHARARTSSRSRGSRRTCARPESRTRSSGRAPSSRISTTRPTSTR